MYDWIYRQLCWATFDEACAPDGRIAWYKKIARRLLPPPKWSIRTCCPYCDRWVSVESHRGVITIYPIPSEK